MDNIAYIQALERTNEELIKTVLLCKTSFETSQRLLLQVYGIPFGRLEAR